MKAYLIESINLSVSEPRTVQGYYLQFDNAIKACEDYAIEKHGKEIKRFSDSIYYRSFYGNYRYQLKIKEIEIKE
jgi:hypothetical protein